MNVHSVERTDTAGAKPPRLRITRVETIPLKVPFKVTFKFSAGPRPDVDVLLVRLHTDGGLSGVGETQAWRRKGSSDTLSSLVRAIEDHLAPRVIGRSPFDIASIMHAMDEALDHSLYAKAPISDALYDLQGQALGVPVYELLGGKCRDTIPLCAPIPIRPDISETLDKTQQFYDRGFRTFLIKIGIDPKADYDNVKAIRERFGPSVCLRVDANAGMGFDDALVLLKKLEPLDIDTAEQPLDLWDLHGMAELARRVNIPIMADESVATDHDLINVIRMRAASVVQTKQAKNGGIWKVRRLWHIAAAADMRIYPGNHPSVSVATSAVAHLAAAWPGPLLEGPFAMGIGGELADDVVTEPLRLSGNKISPPSGPGLGVTLDEKTITRLRVDA